MNPVWSEEAGAPDAPLVVLIHGTMDRSAGMLKLSRQLDDRMRVLRYDRRGYGRSAPHHGPFDMAEQVGDLVHLLGGRRAVLVGHSYGGNVALATANQYPTLVAGVAMYETPLSWEPWWPGTTAGAAARATEGTSQDAAERFMRRLIGDDRWENLPERTRDTRMAEGAAMVGELRDLQANRPWIGERIGCPLMVSYGSNGAQHHRDGMTHVHEMVSGSTMVELAGCRHDAPMSHANLFATMIVVPLLSEVGGSWAEAISRPEQAP